VRTTFRGALGLFRQSLRGHLEKLLVSDKSHAKHGKTHLFAKGLFSSLVGLGKKFEFFEVPYCLFYFFGFLPRFLALEFNLPMLGELCFARLRLILSSPVKQIPPQCSLTCVIFRVTGYCAAFYAAALLIGVAHCNRPV
jgi:hypothetical protein